MGLGLKARWGHLRIMQTQMEKALDRDIWLGVLKHLLNPKPCGRYSLIDYELPNGPAFRTPAQDSFPRLQVWRYGPLTLTLAFRHVRVILGAHTRGPWFQPSNDALSHVYAPKPPSTQ